MTDKSFTSRPIRFSRPVVGIDSPEPKMTARVHRHSIFSPRAERDEKALAPRDEKALSVLSDRKRSDFLGAPETPTAETTAKPPLPTSPELSTPLAGLLS